MKILICILLALVVLIGAYTLTREHAAAPVTSEQPEVATTTEKKFSWRFAQASSTADDLPPRTQVTLMADSDVYDAGLHAGSCAAIETANLLPYEKTGVLCWWAGAGNEIGVFQEGSTYVVKMGVQEESTAETEGFRGDFKELFTLR